MFVRGLAALLVLTAIAVGQVSAASSLGVPVKVGTQMLKWKTPVIRLAVSTSLTQPNSNIKFDSDVVTAINKSIEAWQDVADVELKWESTDSTTASPAGVAGDGVSLITIAPTVDNVLIFADKAQNDAAKTRIFYNKGFINEADIVLNPYQQFSTDGTFGTFDLQATLTHEIGHLLGLGHSGVKGSTMSGSFSRNGLFGVSDVGSRTLDASDISAIRELYGATDDDLCCATVSGKLPLSAARGARSLQVWAQETSTGRVAGLAEAAGDGTFTLGGLAAGTYRVLWQRTDDSDHTVVGDLGRVALENLDNRVLTESKTSLRRSTLSVGYIGLNGQLADSSVGLNTGRQYTLYVGGSDIDPGSINIEASNPSIKVDPLTFARQDFGNGISAVTFHIETAPDTKPGSYSLMITRSDGSKAILIGALNVE